MCLIVFAWRPGHPQPLLVAANRDEFYDRPSRALTQWEDHPGVYAGRDVQAGGTWLGVGPNGRFAAVTNIRDLSQPPGARSRGELTADFLRGEMAAPEYLVSLAKRTSEYSGFNLLLGDSRRLFFFNPHEGSPRELPTGVYGLSNASLDSPWPKLLRTREALRQHLDHADPQRLLALLADRQPAEDAALPDTGIGLASERMLSSVFIASPTYGTRASTALILQADGHGEMVERSFGPDGVPLGEVRLSL